MDCKIKNVTDNDFQAKDLLYIHPRIFEMAIKAGVNALNRNTFYHPITSSGTVIWGEIVGVFRRTVVQTNPNWQSEFRNGLSMLINRDLNATIVISSGNSATGIPINNPCTRNSKGSATYDYVGHNYELWNSKDEDCPDTHRTHVLLYHVDRGKKEIRFELSLPMYTRFSGKKGKIHIYKWQKRIIFESVSTHVIETNNENYRWVAIPKIKRRRPYQSDSYDHNF